MLALCGILAFHPAASGDDPKWVDLRPSGSAPPIPGLYECIWKLKEVGFERGRANECLRDLLSTGYFEEGAITLDASEVNNAGIVFNLRAKRLLVTGLQLKVDERYEMELRQWLGADDRVLRKRDVYERSRENVTATAIELFFKAKGVLAGVTVHTDLSYSLAKAELIFEVTLGSPIPSQSVPPPYGPDCAQHVGGPDWSDFDDRVPRALVGKLVILRPGFMCFSNEKLQRDLKVLRETNIFEQVDGFLVSLDDGKQLSLRLRGRPLIVRAVSVQGYGSVRGQPILPGELPLKPGMLYSQSMVSKIAEKLARDASQEGLRIVVKEDVQLVSGQEVQVEFHVLGYAADNIVVDGRKVN